MKPNNKSSAHGSVTEPTSTHRQQAKNPEAEFGGKERNLVFVTVVKGGGGSPEYDTTTQIPLKKAHALWSHLLLPLY